MSSLMQQMIDWTERGRVPDPLVRIGVRHLLRERLEQIQSGRCGEASDRTEAFIAAMDAAVPALLTDKANEQHYEVPAAFFGQVLGARRKYSGCYWPEGVTTLDAAEEAALGLTCARAALEDGQRVLELGCGWGSLSLWMAERYPASQVTAVSNSVSQREYILGQAAARGLANLSVVTCDMNRFEAGSRYDRIVSVEMFEHMRNWRLLFSRLAGWLEPRGRFFMHVFCHRAVPYAFEERDAGDWMSRYFFSGGMMPSDDLALRFQDELRLLSRWRWDGRHYERTANAWLANQDRHRAQIWPVLQQAYGESEALRWWNRWRLFFIACAELFGYENGQQWWVSHYLFEPRR